MRAYITIATRVDRGAIAVVRIGGPDAIHVADSVFRPHRGGALRDTPPGRLRYGRAGPGRGDEVVAVVLEGPQPVAEIHGHGGTAAIASVVRALQDAGAVVEDDEEGDVLDAQGDRIRTRAMADLASAPTLRVAEILLDQARGTLSEAIARLLADAEHSVADALEGLDALIRRGAVGTRLVVGWKVVIAGRPNVGKSRLFNALSGFDRSIVNASPGVTRDVVSFRTAFAGWPVELCDTAGERDSDDAVERQGIDRSRREKRDADLVLVVLDRSEPLQSVDRVMLAGTARALAIANKLDLPPAWDVAGLGIPAEEIVAVSAETGAGLGDLVGAITNRLVPEPPEPGVAVPIRPEHLRSLKEARACLVGGDIDGFARRLEALRRFEAPP
jgi:tRNA modification GTPase